MTRVLVACVGNIFKSDDGFGVEVAAAPGAAGPARGGAGRRLRHPQRAPRLRAARRVRRAGAGRHGRPSRRDRPVSLFVIEPELARDAASYDEDPLPEVMLDAHDLSPGGVMALVPDPRVDTWTGSSWSACSPVTLEDGIGLSAPVACRGRPGRRPGRHDRRPGARPALRDEHGEGGGGMKKLFKLALLAAIGAASLGLAAGHQALPRDAPDVRLSGVAVGSNGPRIAGHGGDTGLASGVRISGAGGVADPERRLPVRTATSCCRAPTAPGRR